MDRSDVLTKSHSSTETLSITDAVRHLNNNANSLDTESVFKLISSANDLDHQQRRFDLDKMDECTKQTIINKFLSGASALTAAAAAAAATTSTQQTNNDDNVDTMINDSDTGKYVANVQQLFDAQNITTKNKRKNFKPRNATAAIDTEPSANDQILLNLMMENKLKQLQDMNSMATATATARASACCKDNNDADDDSNGGSDSDANESRHSYKSPPSSPPMENGHDDPFKMNLLRSLQQQQQQQQKHSNQSLAAIYSQFLPMLPITSQSTDYGTTTNDPMDSTYAAKRSDNALLKKTNHPNAVANPVATTTATNQKQQQNALIPPTPPRTPITTSTQQQQMTDGGSDDDDSENKSVIPMANRKRKLNPISGSNKRVHMENLIKIDTDNTDSDSNHEYTDRPMSSNDNDDASSRISDFDDGNISLKNRPYTDINDASFDSSLSAYLQETNKAIKAAQPTLNLSQSLSNIVDVSGLNLTKDKYFEKPTMNFLSPANNALKLALQTEDSKLIDSGKYLSKYSSFMECNHDQCAIDKLREHFHCLDILCLNVNKVLCKREEVLRHLKWHKKRNESLTHGFLRFSSTDDCSIQFGECQHNGKQTHYHCLQGNCDKVYISTSDVQMHSNYHRKDSAIMQEGFQRFRATEECSADFCTFAGQRTTHFHCIRDSCNYTFKNKAEMEKHKTYHIKDELLARDGFKKFMKNEPCSFDRCRFSLQCNHIHCVRENCFYVLHSSGQLLSHKRKHDRQDSEHAYQQYKNAHKGENSFNAEHNELEKLAGGGGTKDLSHIASILSNFGSENNDSFDMFQQLQKQALLQSQAKAAAAALVNKNNVRDDDHNSLDNNNYDPIDAAIPKSFIQNANATLGRSITPAELEQLKQIYSAAESAKQKQINALLFAQNNFNGTDQAEPLNLNVKKESKDLNDTLLSAVVQKIQNQNIPSSLQQVTSIDGLFNRKRGRPPKNRVVEVYGNVQTQASPSAIFTSFKLEKNGKTSSPLPSDNDLRMKTPNHNQSADIQPDGNTSSKESTSPQFLSNRLSDSSGSSTNDRKRRLSFSTSPSNDADKVSIVRAAGTFFPQNCGDENETSISRRKSKESSTASDYSMNPSKKCKASTCNQSNENHFHCDECSETFDDESKLAMHSQLKHKDETADDSPTQEMLQNLAKQMASQQQSLFGMDSFMNPALMLNQMQINNDGFQFNDQLSAQIQTLCLAQLAALYQNNPLMYQHLYPLLGAIEQLKQDPAQRMFPAMPMNPLPFGGFDLTKVATPSIEDTKKAVSGKRQTAKTVENGKLASKQTTLTGNIGGNNRNSGNFKIFKDEPIPTGYLKFRFNEDCNFPNCGYSNLQSHFHCCRTDCHYSFCDKTRFVQHTARHERLDKLMGDDFKQYRANMSCGYDDCVYKSNMGANNKSSHFHCLKCDFICSDTNKVVAHRRHHNKLEYIRTAGFRKIANNERCTVVSKKQSSTETDDESMKSGEHDGDGDGDGDDDNDDSNECIYSMKQTHYHCLVCDCAVLSRAQLGSHHHKN